MIITLALGTIRVCAISVGVDINGSHVEIVYYIIKIQEANQE